MPGTRSIGGTAVLTVTDCLHVVAVYCFVGIATTNMSVTNKNTTPLMQRQLTTLACYFHSSVDICCRVGRVCMSELTCKLPTCEEQNRAIAVQHIFHGDAIIDSVVASTAYRNQVYHAVRTRTLRIIHPVYKIIIITQPVLYVRIISVSYTHLTLPTKA